MKKAFICSQLIHVMRSIQLNREIESFMGAADIFIDSSFINAKEIAQRLQKMGCFNRVIYIDPSSVPQKAPIAKIMWGHSSIAKSFRKEKYETIVCFNLESYISTALFNINKNNDNFSYHYVEDGPGLFPISVIRRYAKLHPYHILGIDKPFFHTKAWWFSAPELMTVPLNDQVKCKLPSFDVNDKNFRSIINEVFDYQPDISLENADIVIMEESFYTDGMLTREISDFDIYDTIRKEFPDKKILVKLHPRTKHNRFEADFEIMTNQGIPWEIYLLNMADQYNKIPVQIGIRCNTLQSDQLCFGMEGKKISLAPMFVGKIQKEQSGTDVVGEKMVEQLKWIRSRYDNPDQFIIASSLEEVMDALHNWFG